MSNGRKDGGSAFPVPMTMDDKGNFHHSAQHPDMIGGMSLRDYFAAAALRLPDIRVASTFSFRWASRIAYKVADAMLKAREQ